MNVDDGLRSIDIGLWTTTTKNNPMVEFSNEGNVLDEIREPLARWINLNESHILSAEVGPRAPQWMEGPVANEPFNFTYNLSGIRTNLARYKYSLSTCSGCHAGDTGRSFQFQMVKSNGKNDRAFFVPFMVGNENGGNHIISDRTNPKGEKHAFFDLKAREEIARDILTVSQQVDVGAVTPHAYGDKIRWITGTCSCLC